MMVMVLEAAVDIGVETVALEAMVEEGEMGLY